MFYIQNNFLSMKKLLNIFLLIIISVVFLSCNNIKEKDLIGKWQTNEIEILNINTIIDSFSEDTEIEFTEDKINQIIEGINETYMSNLKEVNYVFNEDNTFFINENDKVHKWRLNKNSIIIQRQDDSKDILRLNVQSLTKNQLIFNIIIAEEIILDLQITCTKFNDV